MRIIQIAYEPNLSFEFKKFIKTNVNPSMWCDDSQQYFIDFIIDSVDNLDFEIEGNDNKTLLKFLEQGIDYIEI